jgi:hypothetical protein
MPMTPEEFVERVRRRVNANLRDWALGDFATAVLDLPLSPPSEREAIADLDGMSGWVRSWRDAADRLPIAVTWTQRAWPRVGVQSVPSRAFIQGADALAGLAAEGDRLRRWAGRVALLREQLDAAIEGPLRSHLREIGDLDEQDFERLISTISWLVQHPESKLRPRELPVRGMDTKWLEKHRSLVESLTLAVTGRGSLGLNERTEVGRIRLLDPGHAVGGLRDIAAPIEELAAMELAPQTVLVVENLQTFLSLPPMLGVLAAYGQGNSVVSLARIRWLRDARIIYWGDLDSHGFRILHQARAAGLRAQSVLMDTATLYEHRDLWVPEPKPFTGAAALLTEAEASALTELRALAHIRLEQERIPWAYALRALQTAVATGEGRVVPMVD